MGNHSQHCRLGRIKPLHTLNLGGPVPAGFSPRGPGPHRIIRSLAAKLEQLLDPAFQCFGQHRADYQALCLSLPSSTTQFQATRGVRWHYGAPGHSLYNHRRPPNDRLPDCRGGLPHSTRSDPLWSWLSLNIAARSKHPGGVNSLLADGHVQFIKDSINVATWQALGSRNGGEVISADGY